MKKKRSLAKQRRQRQELPSVDSWVHRLADLVTVLLDRFGWPGLLVLVAFVSLYKFASDEQKREIIDVYFLGKGIGDVYPVLLTALLALGLLLAQRRWYRKKLEEMQQEIDRITKAKGQRQEEKIGADLHHTDVQEE